MMKKNNVEARMNALKAAGYDTSKFIVSEVNGTEKVFKVEFDSNGVPIWKEFELNISDEELNPETQKIIDTVYENGHLKQNLQHGRFVSAQYMKMMNYNRDEVGRYYYTKTATDNHWRDYLKDKVDYNYQYIFLRDEIERMFKLSKVTGYDAWEAMYMRASFFNFNTINQIMDDYIKELQEHIDGLCRRKSLPKHAGKPYITIYKKYGGKTYVHVSDCEEFIDEIKFLVNQVKEARSWKLKHNAYELFMEKYVKLPQSTRKSRTWIDCYQGLGAFRTLQNFILYSGLRVDINAEEWRKETKLGTRDESYKFIWDRLRYKEGYQFHAILVKALNDNGWNYDKFVEICKETYNK